MAWHGLYSVEQTEAHVRNARGAVAGNDLQRAFHHITTALTTDPLHPEWRAILDEVIRRSTDASELAPSGGQAALDFVSATQRAYVSASKHDFKAAILFLARAAQMRPEAPMLLWAREWLRVFPAAATLDAQERLELMKATLPWVGVVPSPVRLDDARRPNLEALADLLVALAESYPKDALVLYAGGCVLRRLARFDEAIDLAHRAWQIEPTWNTTIGVACALRDSKHVDEAASWYRRALSIKPDELSPLLDLGDMFLDAERHGEAMAAYAQVLQRMPEHPWAEPSLLYTRLKKDAQPKDEGLCDNSRQLRIERENCFAVSNHVSNSSIIFQRRLDRPFRRSWSWRTRSNGSRREREELPSQSISAASNRRACSRLFGFGRSHGAGPSM